jgi:hypothetical protein
MTCWLKLPLAPATLAALVTCGLTACADASTAGPGNVLPGDDAGRAVEDAGPSVGTDATSPVGKDAGSVGSKDSGVVDPPATSDGAAACTLPSAWSQNPTCDDCQVKNCCALIQDCATNAACSAIYDCQSNCYSGIGPDGGALSTADGSTAEDMCASDCLAAGSAAAQSLFTPQDTCVNTDHCATPCM